MSIIKNFAQLATTPQRKLVLELIETAFLSIQPKAVIEKNVSLKSNELTVKDQIIDFKNTNSVFLLGFGKGSAKISLFLEEILSQKLTEGFVIDVQGENFQKIKFTQGTHPLPSQANLDFTQKVINSLTKLTESDLVIIVTCGGGSALFELPNNLSLSQLENLDKALLKSGADIKHMNMIRKHVSQVKGGKLAKILYPAKVMNLIFSDVPGNDFSTIASGPTVKDDTDFSEALDVFEKYRLGSIIKKEDLVETPKGDKYFENVTNILMLSNLTALEAMKEKAKKLNFETSIYSDQFQSDANSAGQKLINAAQTSEITLVGGETTVNVKGRGEGGRNQQLVLSALLNLPNNTIIASFDSDGWDNSPAAGAIGDAETIKKAKEQNLNIQNYIDENNSYSFFKTTGDAILTDRLPSNVSDIMIVYKY